MSGWQTGLWAGVVLAAAGCGGGGTGVRWVEVPVHETRLGGAEWREAGGYELAETETTVEQWARYLNASGADWDENGQLVRGQGGKWRAREGKGREPVSGVTWGEAKAWCEWAGRVEGRRVRLPTGDEWEAGARGGADGAVYPWGWRGPKEGEARWGGSGGVWAAGTGAANGWGLPDMAGNVAEWCDDGRGGERQIRGGAWTDREASGLGCAVVRWQRAEARAGDVGFRALREGNQPQRGMEGGAEVQSFWKSTKEQKGQN